MYLLCQSRNCQMRKQAFKEIKPYLETPVVVHEVFSNETITAGRGTNAGRRLVIRQVSWYGLSLIRERTY